MFPGFRAKRQKILPKSVRELSPGALDGMRHMVEMQFYSMLGKQIALWVNEKPGRKFVMENPASCVPRDKPGSGVELTFTENGEEAHPDFMPADEEGSG